MENIESAKQSRLDKRDQNIQKRSLGENTEKEFVESKRPRAGPHSHHGKEKKEIPQSTTKRPGFEGKKREFLNNGPSSNSSKRTSNSSHTHKTTGNRK